MRDLSTRGETRTLTVSPPADFESAASTNSATLAFKRRAILVSLFRCVNK